MKYKAEDGTELISKKGEEVTYTCDTNLFDGVYESIETAGAVEPPFIKQIKIKRVVSDGVCTYTITESTTEELNQYLEQIKIDNANTQQ